MNNNLEPYNTGHLTPFEYVLVSGVSDWISDYEVMHSLGEVTHGAASNNLATMRDHAVGLTIRLVTTGLALPGAMEPGKGFFPWRVEINVAVLEIAQWSSRLDPDIAPGDIFWLCLTEEGEARGYELLRRDGRI